MKISPGFEVISLDVVSLFTNVSNELTYTARGGRLGMKGMEIPHPAKRWVLNSTGSSAKERKC